MMIGVVQPSRPPRVRVTLGRNASDGRVRPAYAAAVAVPIRVTTAAICAPGALRLHEYSPSPRQPGLAACVHSGWVGSPFRNRRSNDHVAPCPSLGPSNRTLPPVPSEVKLRLGCVGDGARFRTLIVLATAAPTAIAPFAA